MEEINKQIFLRKDEEELLSIQPHLVYDEKLREEIKKRMQFTYPYEKEANLRVKMTVSELKKLGQFLETEDSEILYPNSPLKDTAFMEETIEEISDEQKEKDKKSYKDEAEDRGYNKAKTLEDKKQEDLQNKEETKETEFEATIPNFIRQKETVLTGADLGTIYHKVLKLLDISKVQSMGDLKTQLHEMVAKGKVKEEELHRLNTYNLYKFTNSDIAKRMCKAQANNKLFKEQQFVFGIKANEINKDLDSDELVLIQGIIDVFFEEDGQLVLLDYKSDAIRNEQLLIERYEVQLQYYQRALEQMFKKKVKEKIIYSLYTGKEIRLE
jgi:ATP-dependent helicase/nuclease subunit A